MILQTPRALRSWSVVATRDLLVKAGRNKVLPGGSNGVMGGGRCSSKGGFNGGPGVDGEKWSALKWDREA